MNIPPKASGQITPTLALVISVISLCFSGFALHQQTQQSKTQLWHSMRQEYDRGMVHERRACGAAFANGTMDQQYDTIMSFYETLGYLIKTGRIDNDIFGETWSYDFVAYFKACKPFMDDDRAKNPDHSVWHSVYDLARQYPNDPLLKTPEQIKDFFEEEQNLP